MAFCNQRALLVLLVPKLLLCSRVVRRKQDSFDCYMPEDNGYSYRGLARFSHTGRPCVKWTDQVDVAPTLGNGIGSHSYCRNPDESSDAPWCFVVGPGLDELRREPCSVDICEDELRDFQAEADALKIYMGSRGCSSCRSTLLQFSLIHQKSRSLKGGAPRTPGSNSSSVFADISSDVVQDLIHACQHQTALMTVSNSTAAAAAAMKLTRRRSCGLTEVLEKHCTCSRSSSEIIMKPAKALVDQSVDRELRRFHPTCSNACYSTSCSSCTVCTAVCQTGPYAYCKSDAPATEQKWWAMCGVTTHTMLMEGKKQCGDEPPTGCPN